jgi:hypothetical protein
MLLKCACAVSTLQAAVHLSTICFHAKTCLLRDAELFSEKDSGLERCNTKNQDFRNGVCILEKAETTANMPCKPCHCKPDCTMLHVCLL